MKWKVSPKRVGSLTKGGGEEGQQLFFPFRFLDIEDYLMLIETGSYFAVISHQSQGSK